MTTPSHPEVNNGMYLEIRLGDDPPLEVFNPELAGYPGQEPAQGPEVLADGEIVEIPAEPDSP